MTADALATALDVLGPDEGMDLAQRLGLGALFIIRTESGGFEERASAAWRALGENTDLTPGVDPGESD
jgi:thiamine biosynthesis lipoprotein